MRFIVRICMRNATKFTVTALHCHYGQWVYAMQTQEGNRIVANGQNSENRWHKLVGQRKCNPNISVENAVDRQKPKTIQTEATGYARIVKTPHMHFGGLSLTHRQKIHSRTRPLSMVTYTLSVSVSHPAVGSVFTVSGALGSDALFHVEFFRAIPSILLGEKRPAKALPNRIECRTPECDAMGGRRCYGRSI